MNKTHSERKGETSVGGSNVFASDKNPFPEKVSIKKLETMMGCCVSCCEKEAVYEIEANINSDKTRYQVFCKEHTLRVLRGVL